MSGLELSTKMDIFMMAIFGWLLLLTFLLLLMLWNLWSRQHHYVFNIRPRGTPPQKKKTKDKGTSTTKPRYLVKCWRCQLYGHYYWECFTPNTDAKPAEPEEKGSQAELPGDDHSAVPQPNDSLEPESDTGPGPQPQQSEDSDAAALLQCLHWPGCRCPNINFAD